MTVREFVEQIKRGNLTALEVQNYIEETTQTELPKLRLLYHEVETIYYTPSLLKDEADRLAPVLISFREFIEKSAKQNLLKATANDMSYGGFLEEVQTLRFGVAYRIPRDRFRGHRKEHGQLDLSHYDQDGGYGGRLIRQQQAAINELLNLDEAQIKRHLKRLERVKRRFDKAWQFYKDQWGKFSEGAFDRVEFDIGIENYFIVHGYSDSAGITQQFMWHLQDAMMFKDGCLSSFEVQVREVIAGEVRTSGQSHNHKGELSAECIEDLRRFREMNPDMGVNDFFKRAHKLYNSCRYLNKNGEREKVSWSTIRNRVKDQYPDIYSKK